MQCHAEDKRRLHDKQTALIKQRRPESRRIFCDQAAKIEVETESETGSETEEPKLFGEAGSFVYSLKRMTETHAVNNDETFEFSKTCLACTYPYDLDELSFHTQERKIARTEYRIRMLNVEFEFTPIFRNS